MDMIKFQTLLEYTMERKVFHHHSSMLSKPIQIFVLTWPSSPILSSKEGSMCDVHMCT